jgi:hypothetical protein
MTATPPLSAEQHAAIRAREAAATPGPWEAYPHDHPASGCRCLSCSDPVVGWTIETPASAFCDDLVARRSNAGELNDFRRPLASCGEGPLLRYEDAEFAAHAREAVPALLAEVDRLRAERAEAAQLSHQYRNERDRLRAELAAARCACYPDPLDHEDDCPRAAAPTATT